MTNARAFYCARQGCDGIATWQPVLLLFAKGIPDSVPAKAAIGIGVCDECKLSSNPEDFVTDEGWRQIVETFAAIGRAEPDRARVGLEWNATTPGRRFRGPDAKGFLP